VSNILLAYQNRTDEGTLSNGTWLSTLPLTNLQNRLVQRVARSNDATLAATKFDIDLVFAKTIGVVALVVHNFSVSSKVRVLADDVSDFATPTYNSGWIDVWPSGMIPQELLNWEDDNFWLGNLSANSRAGYQSPFIHVLSSAQTYRYWRVEIDDTTNTDGYIQIGRLFMSATWTPTVNYNYGAALGYKDTTGIETSLSGAEYFELRTKVREFSFTLEWMSATEAYDIMLQLQRVAGVSGEILQIPDQSDIVRMPARAYVGRLVNLEQIDHHKLDKFKVQLTIRELA
jgi:hypothetical protein